MKNEINMKMWLELKPYYTQTQTDHYYLRLCNKIKHMLRKPQYKVLKIYLSQREINLLSCFLVSYYEDISSETNIWNTFVKTHFNFYEKRIPFFDSDDTNDNIVNKQDIRFLVWYFLNIVQEEKFINPNNDFLLNIAKNVEIIFLRMSGSAPINLELKSYYDLDPKTTDYYIVRKLIDTILFNTYLFYPDITIKLLKEEDEIFNKEIEKLEEEPLDQLEIFNKIRPYLNENRDSFISKKCTRLLSLKGKEWAAKVLGDNHPLFNDINNISRRISGLFLFKREENKHVIIEHIASGREFNLIKESFDHYSKHIESEAIVYISIVKWKESWWFSGITVSSEFNADVILDEKNSFEHRRQVDFLDSNTDQVLTLLDEQRKSFLTFNNNSLIAFMTSDKANNFFKDFIKYHNTSLNISKEDEIAATKRLKKEGFLGAEANNKVNFPENDGATLVFFNPKRGIEIAMNINSAFPATENPFFNEEESYEDTLHLLMSDYYSTELAMQCIDNYKSKLPFFNTDIGQSYLDDIDFLLRFWKSENYHTVPAITLTGKKNS